jgi:eukaryotic-like serine/threonine-protein kinase
MPRVPPNPGTRPPDDGAGAGAPPAATRTATVSADGAAAVASTAAAAGAAAATGNLLRAGSWLAGRYRIVRFIARGGMGDVYEVEDIELGTAVALKTIRTDRAADAEARERFRREIQLARRITHPNVCRIFDVGFADTAEHSLMFLTMELLAGETLADRLARAPLSPAEQRALIPPLIEALAAAHAAGVVHRDFKSGNVILAPSPSGTRPVVTDFGLAKTLDGNVDGGGGDVLITGLTADRIIGTPGYMAPEQLVGGAITAATDVYALGVVLFEMTTGRRPAALSGEVAANARAAADAAAGGRRTGTGRSSRAARATRPGRRRLAPELDRHRDAIIRRCLQTAPADRYQSAAEVARAWLGGRRRRRLLAAAAALLVAGATATALVALRPAGRVDRAGRAAVAVLGIANLSGRADAAWLTTAVSELLTAELAQGAALRTVPDETVARVRRDLGIAPGQSLARDTLARVRANLDADHLIMGSYLLGDGNLVLTLRLQDVASGEVVQVANEQAPEKELLALVSRAGGALRQRLGVVAAPAAAAPGTDAALAPGQAALPRDPAAARLYVEGLEKWRAMDLVGATALIDQSLAIEDGFPLAHAALATIWAWRHHDGNARQQARRAFELSSGLARDARLLIEGRLRETNHEWERATEIYADLWRRYPDDLEHGLALARAQGRGKKARDALVTTAAMRRLPAPQGDDPRIDIVEADAHSQLGDYKAKEVAAASAIRKGRARGARELVAQAAIQHGWSLQRLGRFDEALKDFAEARALSEGGNDRAGVGHALHSMSVIHLEQGTPATALEREDQAIAILRAVGDELGLPRAINVRALALTDLGRLGEALAGYREAEVLHRRIEEHEDVAYALGNQGMILIELGDLRGAEAALGETRRHFEAIGNKYGLAMLEMQIGTLERARGDLAAARARFDRGRAALTALGADAELASAEQDLGDLSLAAGKRAEARASFQRALAANQPLKIATRTAHNQLALARLALDEGAAPEAEKLARQALAAFQTGRLADEAVGAALVLSQALDAAGRADEARALREKVVAPGERSESLAIRLRSTSALTPPTDRARLSALERQATAAGLVELALELRLAHARSAADRAALARDARARGFVRIAELAAAARP